MLGKRKYTGTQPSQKRKWGNKKGYSRRRRALTYGPGYNPKAPVGDSVPSGAELKYFDVSEVIGFDPAHDGIPCAKAIQTFNNITQGDQQFERNGNKILVKKFTIRGTCEHQGTSTTDYTTLNNGTIYFRVMLFIDSQCNGAFPSLSDLFEEQPTGHDEFDIYNGLSETGRYKCLMDKFLKLDPVPAAWNTNTERYHTPNRLIHFKKTFDLNLPMRYYDQYGNLGSLRTNNIFMIIFSGSSTNSRLVFNYRSRLRFYDY